MKLLAGGFLVVVLGIALVVAAAIHYLGPIVEQVASALR